MPPPIAKPRPVTLLVDLDGVPQFIEGKRGGELWQGGRAVDYFPRAARSRFAQAIASRQNPQVQFKNPHDGECVTFYDHRRQGQGEEAAELQIRPDGLELYLQPWLKGEHMPSTLYLDTEQALFIAGLILENWSEEQ